MLMVRTLVHYAAWSASDSMLKHCVSTLKSDATARDNTALPLFTTRLGVDRSHRLHAQLNCLEEVLTTLLIKRSKCDPLRITQRIC